MNEAPPGVLLSGFSDEAAPQKTLDQQFATMAALGMKYVSLRFIDVGNGVKNVLALTADETSLVRKSLNDYGLRVSSIGSPIGKVKIVDVADETDNRFIPFEQYLQESVERACQAAIDFDTTLIRGFSFYHPRHEDPQKYLSQAIDQLGRIADVCHARGLTFGLEVEANLIGSNGDVLAEIYRSVDRPSLLLVFDGANLVTQGYNQAHVLDQFEKMIPGLGWMHVKDYRLQKSQAPGAPIDEEALREFVPADIGDTGHREVFRHLREHLPTLTDRIKQRGAPGFFVDLEPHLRGGGQFGGFSGADGMGVAFRALSRVLCETDIEHPIRDFESIQRSMAR